MDIPWKDVRKIVVLNLIANTVGDTLMVGPVIQVLKRHCPKAEITCTASPQNAPLLEGLPQLDRIVVVPQLADVGAKVGKARKALRYASLMRFVVKKLREIKPDVCFILQPNFAPSQLVPWIARVPYRVGYTYKGSRFSWALTHSTSFRGTYETFEYYRHFIEVNFDILRAVGIPINPEDTVVRKFVSKEAKAWANDFLKKHKLTAKDKLVAVQAGAKWENKRWPVERFVEVAKVLAGKHHATLLLFGAPQEKETNDKIAAAIPGKAIPVLGESLEHVAALLERCTLAFGNDSGIMHLASSVGTKPAVIYAMSIPENSGPRGPGGVLPIMGPVDKDKPVLSGDDVEEGIKRMKNVTVEMALAVLEPALK